MIVKKNTVIGYKNHLYSQETWSQDLELIRSRAISDKLRLVNHLYDSLTKRGMTVQDVLNAICDPSAEIIQGHAKHTYPYGFQTLNQDELRVVFGRTQDGKVIHVVIAMKTFNVVTVYFPTNNVFQQDLKTLRTEFCFKPIFA